MISNRPATLVALTAGFLSAGLAFVSSAGAEDYRAENAPVRVATAVFAGGCFSCVEDDLSKLDGVVETITGYSGGALERPSTRRVREGGTGHLEAVKVTYDPSRLSYDKLATYFLRTVDPTDAGGQFCERGDTYRSAIFVNGESERVAAEAALSEAGRLLNKPIATEVRVLTAFWPAEVQHQDYHIRQSARYAASRAECGRDIGVLTVWGEALPAL